MFFNHYHHPKPTPDKTRFAQHTKSETFKTHSFESPSPVNLSWNAVQSTCKTIRSNKLHAEKAASGVTVLQETSHASCPG